MRHYFFERFDSDMNYIDSDMNTYIYIIALRSINIYINTFLFFTIFASVESGRFLSVIDDIFKNQLSRITFKRIGPP